jgi:hypothetical protein
MTVTAPNVEINLPLGMKLFRPPGAHERYDDMMAQFFATPYAFCYVCPIVTINDVVEMMQPTDNQKLVATKAQDSRFIWVNKYRQAFITTLMDMMLLRDCMYGEGIQGAFVAQKEDTHKEHMRRISFTYNKMKEDPILSKFIVPLKKNTSATISGIEFIHGGGIWPITAGSDSPGVGRSFSRVVETESCEMPAEDFHRLNTKFYPTITKRPFGRIWRESTPGKAETPQHRAWLKALKGNSRFEPVFLKWWEDSVNTVPLSDKFSPITEEEKEYARRLKGITKGHVYFRRFEISDFCDGDENLFEVKYPSGPLKGWTRSTGTVFDQHRLQKMYDTSISDDTGRNINHYCLVAKKPNPYHRYVLVIDPTDFGATGDNAAMIMFDRCDWEEVAKWEGREDPTKSYPRAKEMCKYYNNATMVIESNCSAFIALATRDDEPDAPPIYYEKKDKPGWRATSKSIQEGEAAVNELLKEEVFTLNFASTIEQMLHFDGNKRDRRVRNTRGEKSHFDSARCAVIAAHWLYNGGYCAPISEEELRKLREAQAERDEAIARERFIAALKRNGRYEDPNADSVWAPGAARRMM